MKRFVVAAAALTWTTMAAGAADVAVAPIYKAPPLVATHNWTGLYAGLNLGGSFGRERSAPRAIGIPLQPFSAPMNGIIGGVQAGYNLQTGAFVWGVEADFQGSSQRSSTIANDSLILFLGFPGAAPIPDVDPFTISETVRLTWFGTARARAGVTLADRWLVYATGGVAFGRISITDSRFEVASAIGSNSVTKTGWTIGGGVEWAMWENWSAKAEYLYIDLGSISNAFGNVTTTARVTDNIVRAGINYRFSPGPVVARY